MNKVSPSFFNNTTEYKMLFGIVIFAILTRIAIPPFIGHPSNFSPIDATALFCGAYYSRRLTAFFVVLLSVWVGDLLLNKILMGHWMLFYSGCYWQYGCYLLITLIGVTLKNKIKPIRLAVSCLASSVLFFGVSNFGVWCSGYLYPFTWEGLVACYISAIPFFKNTLFSDLFFSMVLFGSVEWFRVAVPAEIRRKH